jgi:hypothetical protein
MLRNASLTQSPLTTPAIYAGFEFVNQGTKVIKAGIYPLPTLIKEKEPTLVPKKN